MEDKDGGLVWNSDSPPDSMVSITIARVLSNLLTARPSNLYRAVSRLSSSDSRRTPSSLDSLEESLRFFHEYVGHAVQNQVSLDQVLIPLIEHSLRFKDSKHVGQTFILLNWLFEDDLIFQVTAKNLAGIITRNQDRYFALSWCILVRSLVQYEAAATQYVLNGISERYNELLKTLCSCLSRLSTIMRNGSCLKDGFELPSRLAVSAADCLLAITNALTKKTEFQSSRQTNMHSDSLNQPVVLQSSTVDNRQLKRVSSRVTCTEMEYLLLNHLGELINLVDRLLAWSRKSRPLYAEGLKQVVKWLQEIEVHYGTGHSQNEAGLKILSSGAMLLSSCWKHYSILLFLEDHQFSQHHKEWLDQNLSGIQYYSGENAEDRDDLETRKFFTNCLCLLLGRLDNRKMENVLFEYGLQISQVLSRQFNCHDEDLINEIVCIFKAIIFKSNGGSPSDTRQMDVVLPSLLHLLHERDGPGRAAVMLIAEYCSISGDDHCLQEVLKCLASRDVLLRRNAIDVIFELIYITSDSRNVFSQSAWQDIASHLLECLKDEEAIISEQASSVLSLIEPSLVLPSLVHLFHSSDERMVSSASNALVGMLKLHNQKVEVICLLLDCLSISNPAVSKVPGDLVEESKVQSDRVLKLIPEWAQTVQDWNLFIGPIIDRMFAEPSNAIIVRFLSMISHHFVEAADEIFCRILSHVKEQKMLDESFFERSNRGNYTREFSLKIQQSLFERLCPLLIIRMLPLEVFNDRNLSTMYAKVPKQVVLHGIDDFPCAAALLLNRAFSKFEFEDVRKLAAELCGRLHPQVLFPQISPILKDAVDSHDILRIKACLFSICTSIMIRGRIPISYTAIFEIIKNLEMVLLWPSLDGDEVSSAQHGCIDCLALMICAEVQALNSSKDTLPKKIDNDIVQEIGSSVLGYVMHCFIHGKNDISLGDDAKCELQGSISLSFCLCMANAMISAFQKISESSRRTFAQKSIPYLIHSFEVITLSEIRAACMQVLFSAVYHLKSAVLPYASDLFKISLNFLKNGQEKERMASVKLMTSLLASEDAIVENISGELLDVIALLSKVCPTDPSPEIRQVCEKMLHCLTSP